MYFGAGSTDGSREETGGSSCASPQKYHPADTPNGCPLDTDTKYWLYFSTNTILQDATSVILFYYASSYVSVSPASTDTGGCGDPGRCYSAVH